MMKKLVTLSIVLCMAYISALAQGKYEDVVYLKNGSIIHGMIVEHVPNKSLSIKSGTNLFVYNLDEVAKYTREEVKGEDGNGGYGFKPKGYVGTFELGLADYPGGGNLPMAAFMLVNSYQFNPYVALGLGLGAEVSSQNIYNVPVYADTRFYFTKTRVAPYANIGFGYNLNIASYDYGYYYGSGTNYNHGMMFNPAIGVRFAITKKVGVGLNVGYKLLNSYVEDYYSDKVSVLTHGVTIRAGVIF